MATIQMYLLSALLVVPLPVLLAQHFDRCTPEYPCYNRTLVFSLDANISLSPVEGDELLRHYDLIFGDRPWVIAEGRRAAQVFMSLYGLNMTDMPDETFMRGVYELLDGAVVFYPYQMTPPGSYRLYMASRGEEVQFFNLPISDAGWIVEFKERTFVNGSVNQWVPAGSLGVVGAYIIKPCPRRDEPCRNVLECDEDRQGDPIPIFFQSVSFMPFSEMPAFAPIECAAWHPRWGYGRVDGILYPGASFIARAVVTFY